MQHNRATLSNTATFNLHKVVSCKRFRKVFPVMKILFNLDSTHIIISSRLKTHITMCARRSLHTRRIPSRLFWQDNGLREGVGEYSAEYSPYSRNKPFTPILPARMIFSPILYLPVRLSRTIYSSRPLIRIYCPRNYNWWRPAILVNPGPWRHEP